MPFTNTSNASLTPAGSSTRVRSGTFIECQRLCAASSESSAALRCSRRWRHRPHVPGTEASRSRGRPREVEGPQVRGHTNLELAWTAGPVVILAVIAGFVFWKVSDISATSGLPDEQSQTREQITIDAHQFYWRFVYPNGAISVDHLRLPYNRTVRLKIVSHDVAHSWWVPTLGGKLDAIPGKTNYTSFRPTKLGTF